MGDWLLGSGEVDGLRVPAFCGSVHIVGQFGVLSLNSLSRTRRLCLAAVSEPARRVTPATRPQEADEVGRRMTCTMTNGRIRAAVAALQANSPAPAEIARTRRVSAVGHRRGRRCVRGRGVSSPLTATPAILSFPDGKRGPGGTSMVVVPGPARSRVISFTGKQRPRNLVVTRMAAAPPRAIPQVIN
jgi:hypothetical protein